MKGVYTVCLSYDLVTLLSTAEIGAETDDNKFSPWDSECTGGCRWRSLTPSIMQSSVCVVHSCCMVISSAGDLRPQGEYIIKQTSSSEQSITSLLLLHKTTPTLVEKSTARNHCYIAFISRWP